MPTLRKWIMLLILTFPIAWIIAFINLTRFYNLYLFWPLALVALFLGLWIGGIGADLTKTPSYLLLIWEILPLLIGILLFFFPLDSLLLPFLATLFFCLGAAIIQMTLFLNQLVSATHRGFLAGTVTALILVFSSIIAIIWKVFLSMFEFLAAFTALAFLVSVLIMSGFRPWKKEIHTYMVPGSISPYVLWWIIFIVAFGLYSWAVPLHDRFLIPGTILHLFPVFWIEIVLLAIGGTTFLFAFLPDRLGRKRIFNIASFLLGELCIFAPARGIENPIQEVQVMLQTNISVGLLVVEIFVIGFIIGVGAWLVWAEIGPIRMKGRRAAFGWTAIAGLGMGIWFHTTILRFASDPYLSSWLFLLQPPAVVLYPIAATLILVAIYPLTNAVEVIWNERIIEDLEIRVDSKQVSKAIRDLEIDVPLKSIQDQIESELTQLMKITGVNRAFAKALRNEGYETPHLVAQASITALVQLLGVSEEQAARIKENAKQVGKGKTQKPTKTSAQKSSKTPTSERRKTRRQ